MKRSKKSIAILAAVAVVGVLAVGGIYVSAAQGSKYQNKEKDASPSVYTVEENMGTDRGTDPVYIGG